MTLSDAARAFLDAHAVGHLATADASGVPHVIPLCYARLGDRLYFVADDKPKRHGPRALKRLANLAANPRAALVVDDYDDDWRRLAYLLLHLDAAVVDDGDEYAAACAALRARYAQYRSMPLAAATHPMVRMTVRRWHLWRANA
ncbi:MAG: TIGR03668 family PPOX class F420-dependent oxidoreductase [Candidatus Binatia bacterium]